MKKITFIIILLGLFLSSCIDAGLDTLPAFEEAEITNFDFEFRYTVKNNNGVEQLAVQGMNTEVTITGTTVTNIVNVPPASGTFTEALRAEVSLNNLVGFASISTAAKIEPMDGAAILGVPADFSKSNTYKVIAADGSEKIWNITATMVK